MRNLDFIEGEDALRAEVRKLEQELAEARRLNKKYRAQADGLCDGCGEPLDDAFCTKCKCKSEQERDSALKALAGCEAERGRLREALRRISEAHGCGCRPVCQCDQEGPLRIWKHEAMSIASEALAPTQGGEGKS